jgi:hypothetical protein
MINWLATIRECSGILLGGFIAAVVFCYLNTVWPTPIFNDEAIAAMYCYIACLLLLVFGVQICCYIFSK